MEKDDLQTRMMDFLRKVRNQAERSRGNNVMLTMGSDFQFENAFVNFKSLDLLIDQINSMEGIADVFPEFDGVKAFYSNPEIYTEYKYSTKSTHMTTTMKVMTMLQMQRNPSTSCSNLETKRDDCFPYSDCD